MSSEQQPLSSSPSGSSRRSNGPTISIENVELLEADRQQDKKRSSRGSRQEEAAAAAAAAAAQPQVPASTGGSAFQPSTGGAPSAGAVPYGSAPGAAFTGYAQPEGGPGYGTQQPPQDQAGNFFYPGYAPPPGAPQQQAYGMPGYQNFYPSQQGAPGYGSNPYAFQPQPGAGPPANEYTNMMGGTGDSFGAGGGYGSLNSIGGGMAPPANHTDLTGSSNRGQGALTIDDIEKTFNAVVNQHYPEPASDKAARPPAPSPTLGITGGDKTNRSKTPSHRRSGSESSGRKQHRRSASGGNLPPAGPRSDRSPSLGSNRKRPDGSRTRSLSGTFFPGVPLRRSLSRGNSVSDLQSVGAQSVASHQSVVSDISKSALFQGVTNEGHVQLRFPYEACRLVANKDMEKGILYMQEIPPAEYEAYHLAAEEANAWEHRLDNDTRKLLPQTFYAIRVEDDLYRRVLDEIADSHQMPCGLFFCGHHEDVSHPSVMIATVAVMILFAGMAYIAFVVHA
uniref:Uncharacterized protein n=1 Tax=Entomoneis paludosa TaxID=265537 RepID=A0A7S2YAB4_9STRA|mmetsp:Transcript_24059/g.50024  ORF Transcript_24059/g.50024 Transcript_24059/m.50024 type:complete len:507 (+) Transcript_24059:218-1738(+)|eukprot:CAMPEP_0172447646 /NCGR_PEP_ID=MMETSP1065-20121228/6917_1 /TAXON_ID=265537 /ORGANISM="Amphiprora paludosa, Strain CCMP125" /LENGTH=506 /DNA_ID=CAMNT_0013199007 /DNA_START=167 /DNA_END=1687 /DNA_ORIENTATION=+